MPSKPANRVTQLVRILDSESILGLFGKVANSFAYLVTSVLAVFFLTLSQQGVFFTFVSFATLTVVVELGLNTVIIQFVSHEMAAVENASTGLARTLALSRLGSIGRFAFAWFWTGAALFWAIVGVLGFYFFAGETGPQAVLPGPWTLLVTAVALDLALFPCWSLLEGARRIKSVYAYRAAKAVLQGLGIWAALTFGFGLWSLAIGYFIALPLALWPIASNWDFFRLLWTAPDEDFVSWRNDMMPLQWRLAVSWVAGYFANWALTPLTFKLLGSAAAGRVGLTWALATGVTTVASSVVMVKFSRLGYLVATGRFVELDALVFRQGAFSVALAFTGAVSVVGIDWLGSRLGYRFADRLLPPAAIAIMMVGAVVQQALLPMAAYLRAFKREPYMWLSVVSAVLFLFAFVVFGTLFGYYGMVIGYTAVTAFVVAPSAVVIFRRCRASWTSSVPPDLGIAELSSV